MKKMIFILAALIVLLSVAATQAQEIFDAVKNNDLVKVKTIVEKDISVVNAKDGAGNTPLHYTANTGSVPLTEYLLSKGADINSTNSVLDTPLHESILKGKYDLSKYLIERGCDLSRQNVMKKTPLHFAVLYNQIEIAELLLSKGAAVDIRDDYDRTPFFLAARQTGNVEIGKLLLKNGANLNIKDRYGSMPLNHASWKGFNGFIDLLLDNRAEFDTSRGQTFQMLGFAADCGSVRLYEKVVNGKTDIFSNASSNASIMKRAIAGGSIEIVNKLLDKNIPLQLSSNVFGWTPLHYAALNGHIPMIEFLIEKGAKINERTLSGKSSYNIAEEKGRKELMKVIERLGGNSGPQQFPDLRGPYLGQISPKDRPLIFAPDIVSSSEGDANHGGITISNDGNEIYWNIKNNIWFTKLESGKWTAPDIINFSKKNIGFTDDNPSLSPDNKKMFFTSTRPGSVSERKENIWFVEKTSSGWSDPKPVSDEVNAITLHWDISVSSSGTLFFGGTAQDGFGGSDIYYSKLVNGVYTKPVNLGETINSKNTDHCPYIAPDESYLLFARMSNNGEEFYISFKGKEGKWLKPVLLPEPFGGICPGISPDSKYIFFLNGDRVIWAKANFIQDLKPKE